MDRGMPFPAGGHRRDAEAILLAGGNPAETMPPIMQYFEAQRERGGKLIVADPRRTATAKLPTLHLQLTPGTDARSPTACFTSPSGDGLIDRDFIEARTTGFEARAPRRRELLAGSRRAHHRRPGRAARQGRAHAGRGRDRHGAHRRAAPEQQSHGVDNVLAFINLVARAGQGGKAAIAATAA